MDSGMIGKIEKARSDTRTPIRETRGGGRDEDEDLGEAGSLGRDKPTSRAL
jgi:hypothetical protein